MKEIRMAYRNWVYLFLMIHDGMEMNCMLTNPLF